MHWYSFFNRKGDAIATVLVEIEKKTTIGEVMDLSVDNKYRKNKLATRLMEKLVEDHKHITLKLDPFDEEEIGIDLYAFYKKFGFVKAPKHSMIRKPSR
jgi:N-acetylglutamate synthase-like GNAT family acetyltransferase